MVSILYFSLWFVLLWFFIFLSTYVGMINPFSFSNLILGTTFLISHLYSCYCNFLINKEFSNSSLEALTCNSCRQVIVMHLSFALTIILIGLNRNKIWGLVLMIVVKTMFDVLSHLKEHKVKLKGF